MAGFVYVLTSTAIPGRVKIGRTDRPDAAIRATEIGIALPGKTRQDWITEVEDSARIERSVHAALRQRGLWCNGEWFKTTVEEAQQAILDAIHSSAIENEARRKREENEKRKAKEEHEKRAAAEREAEKARSRSEAEAEERRRLYARISAAQEAWHASAEGRAATSRARWKMSLLYALMLMPTFGWLPIFFLTGSGELHWLAALAITFGSFTLVARAVAAEYVRASPPRNLPYDG